MVIDAHQHFWIFDAERDAWITPEMQAIRKNFLPEDLRPVLKENRVDGCVAVQASQSRSETEFLLQLAEANDFIKGVVGWVDLQAEDLYDQLEKYSQFEKLRGFRHVVQGEAEGFMLQPAFIKGVGQLVAFDFTYDILIRQDQLKEAFNFAVKLPNVHFVLDHIAKPLIKNGEMQPWATDILELAELSNVSCKVSGIVTEADWKNWEKADFRPYLDVVFEAFGTDRLIYGSDWPVCLVAAEYEGAKGILTDYLSMFSDSELQKVMGKNAVEFYSLDV
ncbi:amidohydrolase family protein [Dyadobacter chenhuakuii]|uniref:Amidohydrolase family protein n=1 Tax=Dyadobacter chenhuakuii TaxID=2909339 RepID=A0ABY4XL20_9BACT|nr:amidohydrolase family protein [Dyadobacter chenhuakuii]MCF2493939.1 amidohydrolase family protein [Dyadobacter chenhuakuii]USJ31070.1 amidohydrolase family protein [Dyadobacter chenhuakuii]